MDNRNFEFPSIKKSIEDFINDDDGNITRSKMAVIGTMMLVMSIITAMDGFAAHGSHASHGSHSSTSYVRGHSNSSHSNHGSHTSHASHTSHSNTASHSNSIYSAEGDISYGPSVSSIPAVVVKTQSDSAFVPAPSVTEEVSRLAPSVATAADSNLPDLPDIPKLPGTDAPEDILSPDLEKHINIDPNHSILDDIKEKVEEWIDN